mmetsp:Transcript_952/g.1261  ORF Transcript_952/g.1261 Transcript_952/m.1261 type:complete len:270 (+) Transcript_952:231-1040(+)
MGNRHNTPVIDEHTLKTKETLKLTKKDIQLFWVVFQRLDVKREGVISLDTLFVQVLGEERSLFTNAIFELIDAKDQNMVDFGEFMYSVCTYAVFQMHDMIKFVFFIFDKKKVGYIEQEEVEFLIETLQGGDIKGNVMKTLKSIKFNEDGKVDFDEFHIICKLFPSVLYPAFRIQQNMRLHVLGEQWWQNKIETLQREKDGFLGKCEQKRVAEEKRLLRERRRLIRSELGIFHFHFSTHRRENLEKIHPKPIVYLDKDHDIRITFPDTDN